MNNDLLTGTQDPDFKAKHFTRGSLHCPDQRRSG